MKKYSFLILGLLFWQNIAHAEMLSGTVTNIDPSGRIVTMQRADTNKTVKLHVKDASALESLRAGTQISVDASKSLFGKWETSSIETPASSGASTAASETSSNRSEMARSESPVVSDLTRTSSDMNVSNTVGTPANPVGPIGVIDHTGVNTTVSGPATDSISGSVAPSAEASAGSSSR